MLMKFINGCISDAQKEFEHNFFLWNFVKRKCNLCFFLKNKNIFAYINILKCSLAMPAIRPVI